MGIAGHTPNFTAAGTILPFSCVKAGTTDPFRVQVATLEDEVVLGITDGSTRAFDSTNHAVAGDPVVLQNSEFVQLRAGGTIAVGDGLRPTTNGAVSVATARIQFVACDAAVSGEIFWAQRVGSVEPAMAGPVVYGSSRASRFMADLAAGTDSADFIIIGDSNVGSAAYDFWGYFSGMSETLFQRGYTNYGGPISPAMTSRGSDNAPSFWRSSVNLFAPTGALQSGNTSGGATAYAGWSTNGNLTRYGSSGVPVSDPNNLTGVQITSTNGDFLCNATTIPLRVGQTLTISGTFGGSGTIPSYTNPKTYQIIATNGSTTFQLSESVAGAPIATTTGIPTGLTYKPSVDSRDDWAYLATGSAQYFQTFGYEIRSDHPLAATGQTVFWRIRYGTDPATGGGFAPMVFNGSSAEQFSPRAFQSSLGPSYSYAAYEKSWVTSGTTSYRATWSFVGPSGEQCKGPLAVHSVSMYRKVKGWSVHSHSYLGGFSSDAIATVIGNNLDRIKLLLQEIRERQILAGGSGRVVVMYQFGVNATTTSQPETPTKWVQAAKDIWATYKLAWKNLGYPESDLATVGWVSHQIDAQDNSSLGTGGNLAAVRTAANQMAIDNPDMTVVDIKRLFNYNQLLMGTGEIGATGVPALSTVGKPYYQRISNWPNAGSNFYQHLSGGLIGATTWHPTDGYTAMMNGLVSALLASA